jgi:predicted GTPase
MIVFVGGHGRKIGKSSVVAGLIRALPEAGWTAVKVSRHRHAGMAGAQIIEQKAPDATDSGRYLTAGAARSFLVSAEGDALVGLVGKLRSILENARHAIVESNSLAAWIKPDLFLFVVDPQAGAWKVSAGEALKSVDAFIVVEGGPQEVSHALPENRPRFHVRPPEFVSEELVAFVKARLAAQAGLGNAANRESWEPSGARNRTLPP